MNTIVVLLVYTCSTECSYSINRHGFIFVFGGHLFESEEKKYWMELLLQCIWFNIDLTKQWQWSSFISLLSINSWIHLLVVSIQVSFICFHSIRSIDSILWLQFDSIRFNLNYIILYSFYYTHHGLFFYILSPLLFKDLPSSLLVEHLYTWQRMERSVWLILMAAEWCCGLIMYCIVSFLSYSTILLPPT